MKDKRNSQEVSWKTALTVLEMYDITALKEEGGKEPPYITGAFQF